MDFMNNILNLVSFIFSRKSFKKYLSGKLEPDMDELNAIKHFLHTTHPQLMIDNADLMLQQIEQMKIPYLRDLSVDELNFLLDKKVDLNSILDIVMAKGGLTRGLAAIDWNKDKRCYEQVERITGEERMMTFLIIAIIPILLFPVLFEGGFSYSYSIHGVYVFPVFYLLFFVFILIPLMSIPFNIDLAKKRLKEERNKVIFGE